ncbi:MAG: tRNA (adenosine(37)-N6)-dimethylallyltransferase MiaA [Moorea sp. SIO4G2]|nr:tRNA (adenosine(37)-N6)-dimethylallyltransferase MiaA [Moorena sp. SIO4G2]
MKQPSAQNSKLNTEHSAVIVICGATATGKSSLGIALAQRVSSIILNADSRQVYREFDIGTAKPTLAQQQQVPHYLIDICDPTETLTVADYQQQAQEIIASEHRKQKQYQLDQADLNNKPLFLVGGTGLYIKSIVRGLKIPRVAPQEDLRSQLAALGQAQLYKFLQQIDPVAAQKIHPNDQVRTLRALEVFYVTGIPISQQQGENPPNYPILQIGLECQDSETITQRIAQRTDQMLAAGFVAEVETITKKYGWNLPLLDTLGYREFKDYLAGNLSLEQARELTVVHTRQFAKRQRTWFKAYPEIEWFDADCPDLLEKVWERIEGFLEELRIKN